MGDADKYESDESETSTASTTAGSKYYQISVPNHYLVSAAGTTSSSSVGSSFLRLGSFPTSTSDTGAPSGFTNSHVLASLVGDATDILAAETTQDLNPTSSPTTPSYEGDHNYLLGFMDDTRYRKGDTTAVWQARRSETTRLLTKGGWWDHSDGNRISTTSGDKIEIIQGNYKMLVLGRQSVSSSLTATELASLAANTLITDISGGLMAENGPSPTHCIKSIEYVQAEGSDTWEVYQNNGIGNVYSSFYGDTVDVFLGAHKATWTGNVPSDYTAADSDDTTVYNIYLKSLAIRADLGSVTTGSDPVVIDHVWASKIASYKGSKGHPVPTITDTTYATTIVAKTTAETIDATTTTSGANTALVEATGGVVKTTTRGKTIESYTIATGGSIEAETTASGDFTGTTKADNVRNLALGTLGVANVSSAGIGMTNISAAALEILNLTACANITNLNAGVTIVNLNLGVLAASIDLTPATVHFGFASHEAALYKSIVAPNVQLGTAPDATAAFAITAGVLSEFAAILATTGAASSS